MAKVLTLLPHGLAVFMAVIFLDSLRYKFTDHPKTQVIFGTLDAWAGSLGAPGLFGHTGLFSQYVIGAAELLASALLLAGILPSLRHLQGLGALIGVAIMTGAVGFHTLTPLGLDPNKDGGGLFMVAVANLVFGLVLVLGFRRDALLALGGRVASAFGPL